MGAEHNNQVTSASIQHHSPFHLLQFPSMFILDSRHRVKAKGYHHPPQAKVKSPERGQLRQVGAKVPYLLHQAPCRRLFTVLLTLTFIHSFNLVSIVPLLFLPQSNHPLFSLRVPYCRILQHSTSKFQSPPIIHHSSNNRSAGQCAWAPHQWDSSLSSDC